MDTNDLTAALNEIRERYEDIAHGPAYVDDIRASADDVPVLLAAVEAVLERHRDEDGICDECLDFEYGDVYPVRWPCPTVQAITTALSGGTA